MVIAVMTTTFERVDSESSSHIMRERVMFILSYWYRIPDSYKRTFQDTKYLIKIEVDP